jgi:hypothetical protein
MQGHKSSRVSVFAMNDEGRIASRATAGDRTDLAIPTGQQVPDLENRFFAFFDDD